MQRKHHINNRKSHLTSHTPRAPLREQNMSNEKNKHTPSHQPTNQPTNQKKNPHGKKERSTPPNTPMSRKAFTPNPFHFPSTATTATTGNGSAVFVQFASFGRFARHTDERARVVGKRNRGRKEGREEGFP
ncbi:hypothetical protein P280DRAFT_141243 [Massarina eburnea CBS 473.64]|uniref:Uncharacterized protein n=1 Tax=Massarina eburnea CBS 473.64 TaxID=1395130 RepID=A0A6A6RQW3_9PLEO|nr:hypothetical protein P280DRAFT_141243 [Massarina eburnea CBS 473.64]